MKTTLRPLLLLSFLLSACSSAATPGEGQTGRSSEADTTCGAMLQTPCTGNACNAGLHPDPDWGGLCVACGGNGQTCCGYEIKNASDPECYGAGYACGGNNVLATGNNYCEPACGAPTQAPCQGIVDDNGNTIAACQNGAILSGSTCVACGGTNDFPCTVSSACENGANCTSGCNPGFILSGSTCTACGGNTDVPCAGGCDSGTILVNGKCTSCGANGEINCGNGACNSGLLAVGYDDDVPSGCCVPAEAAQTGGYGTLTTSVKVVEAQQPFTLTVAWHADSCQNSTAQTTFYITETSPQQANVYTIGYNALTLAGEPSTTELTFNASNLSTGKELTLNAGNYTVFMVRDGGEGQFGTFVVH